MDLYTPDPEGFGFTPGGRAEHSASAGVSDAAAAGKPVLPVRPQSPLASASAGPEVAALAVVETITAPPVTVQRRDRKRSPGKPAGSSNDGGRPGKNDGNGKTTRTRTKTTDLLGHLARAAIRILMTPMVEGLVLSPSFPAKKKRKFAWAKWGRARAPRCREADEIKFLGFPLGAQWRAWRTHAIPTVISAVGRQDDDASHWINRCATDDPSSLQTPGEG